MSLVFMHRTGATACGQPAFRLKRTPAFLDPVLSEDAMHLDGSAIKAGSMRVCDSCGRELSLFLSRADIVEEVAL